MRVAVTPRQIQAKDERQKRDNEHHREYGLKGGVLFIDSQATAET